jgi:hypothetical protein
MNALISWILYGGQPKKLEAEIESLKDVIRILELQNNSLQSLARSESNRASQYMTHHIKLKSKIEKLEDAEWESLATQVGACKLLAKIDSAINTGDENIPVYEWRWQSRRIIAEIREFLAKHN